jgi:hypothetical protein
MCPVSTSRWVQLALSRRDTYPTPEPAIDLTESLEAELSDRSLQRRAELALIQGYVDALQPEPEPASR